jgi:hypothetical protein
MSMTAGGQDQPNIDSNNAKSIARRFLEQSYSLIMFKNAILEENTWLVKTDVGHRDEHIVCIKVDAYTGRILECL